MSVILDALKRVERDGRRDAARPATPRRDTFPRHAAPRPESTEPNIGVADPRSARAGLPDWRQNAVQDGGVQLSRTARVGLLMLSLVAVVAVAAWAFQPQFAAPVREQAPLLSELINPTRPASQSPSRETAAIRPGNQDSGPAAGGPGGGDGSGLPPVSGAESPEFALTGWESGTATAVAAAAPAAQDYRDLSANLPAASADPATDDAPASANGGGYIDLTSQASAAPRNRDTPSDVVVIGGQSRRDTSPRPLVDPGVRDAFQQGVRLQKAGDLAGAEEAYKRALKFDPYNAAANANLGVLYESDDRLSLAERHLRAAVEVAPDNANAHNNLGVVLYRMGNYDGALIEFNRTLVLDPERLDAYVNKGLIFTRWGRFDDAKRAFLQVLDRNPEHALAHYNLGLVFEEAGELENALDQYYKFLSVGSANHPEIVDYLSQHLPWIEDYLAGGAVGGVR